MSRPTPPAYKTRNWPAYNEALKRRGSLTIWFDPEMTWEARPTGKRGRQPDYSDAAIQTCLTMKVLFGMAPAHEHGEPTPRHPGRTEEACSGEHSRPDETSRRLRSQCLRRG